MSHQMICQTRYIVPGQLQSKVHYSVCTSVYVQVTIMFQAQPQNPTVQKE